MNSDRLQPAVLGGVFIGVLSALPVVNIGNCCCCLWVLAGGALAVYLRQQHSPAPLEAAEGALMGLLAGAIGGIIAGVLAVLFNVLLGDLQAEWMARIIEGNPDLPPQFRDALQRYSAGQALAIVSAIINFVIYTVFGMFGGLLGIAIFKRNLPPQPPTVIPHDPGMAQ